MFNANATIDYIVKLPYEAMGVGVGTAQRSKCPRRLQERWTLIFLQKRVLFFMPLLTIFFLLAFLSPIIWDPLILSEPQSRFRDKLL